MNGEDILRRELTAAHQELQPNAIFDPMIIVGIITSILELIRGCRNPEAHIKRGSAIAEVRIRRMLKKEDYRGDVRAMARELAKRGSKLTDGEVSSIVEESKDVGFWPLLVVLFLCLSSVTQADDLWPQQCQCKGSNKAVCLCLKNNVKCHCTPTKGSVWQGNSKVDPDKHWMMYEAPWCTACKQNWAQIESLKSLGWTSKHFRKSEKESKVYPTWVLYEYGKPQITLYGSVSAVALSKLWYESFRKTQKTSN